MTVSTAPTYATYDAELGHLLGREGPGYRVILGVLTRAFDLDLSPAFVRWWMMSRTEEGSDLFRACASKSMWWRAVAAVRRRQGQTDHTTRIAVARRLAVHLTDRPGGGRRNPLAKHALGVIAMSILRDDHEPIWATAMVPVADVAVALGATRRQAETAISRGVEKGWLAVVGVSRRGRTTRYRLGRVRGAASQDRAWRLAETIDALATGTGDDPLADVIRSAGHHPVWGYSTSLSDDPDGGTDAEVWEHCIALTGEVDPVDDLRLPKTRAKAGHRRAVEILMAAEQVGGLATALDGLAAAHGAGQRHAEAADRRRAAIATRTAEVRRVQGARGVVAGICHGRQVPGPSANAEERAEWLEVVRSRVGRVALPEGIEIDDVRAALEALLRKVGHGDGAAGKVAAVVMGSAAA